MADLPDRRTCGAHDIHAALMRTNADYARARAAIEAQAMAMGALPAPTVPTVIPVVVHVIHRGGSENIADAQIKSQIDVLNNDYRKKNPDTAKVPGAFQPLVADAFVEFALATIDPQGQPTSGITRTLTNVQQFGTDNAMKFTAQGGHDSWDTTRYLNMWVCPELIDGPRQLLGYAQFPGGLPATDGVAIIHNAFGTSGTSAPPFNLGRTATHEVGHWLDLYHIWGDAAGCNTDDKVGDTPVQDHENFGKPTFPHVSCHNAPSGDMFMNYMDYVDDDSMFMFTPGQVARIRATLAGPRSMIGKPMVAALAGVAAGAGP
ncbi:zinc metalloprotease [Bradyrhizobium manausense]|uniref:zinc metalloprotease n=1 Tax=Bradyrhizobium TaxID=374 RepID=UPI001BAAC7A5|nr:MULTISPECIES: zinc metalloprotease [Bradyrhizobium]MBR0830499.1 zinc metalloprotease [Bradyrhizobium manausense]UVO28269.1 zinc metalloprotease [Bradyrhizobium arachidis]